MRINKFVAAATGLSRRAADTAIANGRVMVNGQQPAPGCDTQDNDLVTLDGQPIKLIKTTTIMLNKPAGYVCSRAGQGSKTIYDLLPPRLHHLKPIGRLDKDSSGLLLLTNDGQLANQLTHPSYQKKKVYEVRLDRSLSPTHMEQLQTGVELDDGPSNLSVQQLAISKEKLAQTSEPLVPNSYFLVTMTEGRNRQIRRTFAALGCQVSSLHRTRFGHYTFNSLPSGHWQEVKAML